MFRFRPGTARLGLAAATLAACAQLALAQSIGPNLNAPGKRDPGDARRGSAATAPSTGGSLSSGGRTNAMGDPKTNEAGAAENNTTAPASQPGPQGKPRVSNADARLMRDLAQAHLAEIKTSGLAAAVSEDQAVRAYAEKMLEEHYQAYDRLKQIAGDAGVVLPGGVGTGQAALLKKLSLLTGKEFNQVYLEQAGVGLHEQSRQLTQAAGRAQAPELKNYAAALDALIAEHHQLARAMLDDPSKAAAAVAATVRAGQSNTTAAFAPPQSRGAQASGNKGNASIAGNPAGVMK